MCSVAETEAEGPTPAQLRSLWFPLFLFVAISVADTVSSVWMLHARMMEEYNPLMRFVWQSGGPLAFIGVKAFLVVVPLAMFNWLKWRCYPLVQQVAWLTVIGYCAIYAVLFTVANS